MSTREKTTKPKAATDQKKLLRLFKCVGNEEYEEKDYPDIPPHPYLAPSTPKKRKTALNGNHQYDFKCEAKLETIQDHIARNDNDTDYINKILIQIGYAVRHLHQHNYATDSKLNTENIYLSEDGTHVFLARFKAKELNRDRDRDRDIKAVDIQMFKILIHEFLREKCDSDHVLGHLVTQIDRMNIADIEPVLKHPHFWSCEKRLKFLVKVCHHSKERSKLRKELNDKSVKEKIIGSGGWKEILKIVRGDERVASDESEGAISDLLTIKIGEIKASYNTNSVLELLRFIRNVKVHFWDQRPENIVAQQALLNDRNGLWKFFNESFPYLFIHVYKCWLIRGLPDHFAEFDELACCRNL